MAGLRGNGKVVNHGVAIQRREGGHRCRLVALELARNIKVEGDKQIRAEGNTGR